MINVIRDQSAPNSLAEQKSYRNPDIIQALYTIFKGKCYLTECKFDYPEEMEIDHFIPQNEDDTKIYDWDNLYPINQKANKQRKKSTPPGGYLDPCNPNDDVENDIMYVVEFGGNALFKPRNPANQKAINTANLLNNLHKDLKPAIKDKHHEVVNAVAEWYNARHSGIRQEELEKELLIKKLLSRKGAYTMLIRSVEAVKVLPDYFFD